MVRKEKEVAELNLDNYKEATQCYRDERQTDKEGDRYIYKTVNRLSRMHSCLQIFIYKLLILKISLLVLLRRSDTLLSQR